MALGVELIFNLFVTSCICRHFCGFSALNHDIFIEIDLPFGASVHAVRRHDGGRVGIFHMNRARRFLGVDRHRRGGDERADGESPALRRGGGRKPAHELEGASTMTGDFLI
ncbi:hypothetical protein [Janthinobacterium lividum]|uniref:hypothetical protein n=1 Tax=Janthinobacterium lividum TaxID=29581 RepID=UPI00201100BD|nr:hypothetical protein [Janthinobacterium lividum]